MYVSSLWKRQRLPAARFMHTQITHRHISTLQVDGFELGTVNVHLWSPPSAASISSQRRCAHGGGKNKRFIVLSGRRHEESLERSEVTRRDVITHFRLPYLTYCHVNPGKRTTRGVRNYYSSFVWLENRLHTFSMMSWFSSRVSDVCWPASHCVKDVWFTLIISCGLTLSYYQRWDRLEF